MSDVTLEVTVAELVRQVEHRYHGKYRGLVVDNADPEHLGRLRVKIPSVLGDQVVTGWALPCVPFGGQPNEGLFAIPDKDAGVWVEFEEGDLEFPVWVGTFWSKPGGTSEVPVIRDRDGNKGDVADPPTRRIITTTRGHTIQIEDSDGNDMILIHEAQNGHTIVLDGKGVKLAHHDGHAIEMTKDAVTITSAKDFTLDVKGKVTIIGASVDFTEKS
jgi:protein required for attachment to host cells